MKTARNQKILSKQSMLSKQVKQQLDHNEKNLLNLEDTSDYDSNYTIDADSSIEEWDGDAKEPEEGDIEGKVLEGLNKSH